MRNVIAKKPGPQGPTIASHIRLRDARVRFRVYLEEKSKTLGPKFKTWLEDFHQKITQHLKIGQYIVGDTTEVGVIFEVMNNRGKALSELEKVKNYLLYVAAKLAVEDNDLAELINAAWAEIFERLMGSGLNDAEDENRLLRAHWLMAYDPSKKGWAGSKSIKGRFDLRRFHEKHDELFDNVRKYVQSLKDSVLVFSEIYAPSGPNTFEAYPKDDRAELRNWATKLTRAGALATFLPILMAVRLKKPRDAVVYLEALKLCEVFAFRVYRWGNRRADAGQTRLFRLGYAIFHDQATREEVSKTIRRRALRYSPDVTFEEEFNAHEENSFYGWSGLRYFLYEYELYLTNGRNVKMTWEQLQNTDVEKTIEHVLPQKPADRYWKDRFNAEACRRLTHSIGNLTLTFDNSSYGRKPYPEKRGDPDQSEPPCYYGSNLTMERNIAREFADWTEEAIVKRTGQFKKWAKKRWQVESKDLADDKGDSPEGDEEDLME